MKKVREQLEDKDCWFCLDNPNIDRKLIINDKLSKHFYLASPKGPIVDEHFLIVPKTHIAHSLELTAE
jgi:diadenosine tetraphosphate (Ap4A) HIT family hydrolase